MMKRTLTIFLLASVWAYPAYADFTLPLVRTTAHPTVLSLVVRMPSGAITEFIVDTGAARIVVGEAVFNREYRDLETTNLIGETMGRTAGGGLLPMYYYSISSFRVSEECTIENVMIAMMPGNEMNLLGLHALKSLSPFTLDIERETLEASNCERPTLRIRPFGENGWEAY